MSRAVSLAPTRSPAETRIAMWRNGYSPLPCHGKRPAMDEWQNHHETNLAEIHLWDRMWPYDRNTGCLTSKVPTLDVDFTDRDACRALFDRTVERFEDCGLVLCRVGNAPKFSVPFRTSAPFKKFEATLIAPAGKAMKFELLAQGQQGSTPGKRCRRTSGLRCDSGLGGFRLFCTCRGRWLSREHFMSGKNAKQRNPTPFNFLAILFQVPC